jgi:protein tyrosine phosphatase (PTP) superfamily phosphohydrolase (DUF442 family)
MSTILNYRYINARLASSGQPLADEIQSIADAGYEAVINLAMPYSPNVLEDEGFRVISLGLDYYHIPVPWEEPTLAHLQRFCALMQMLEGRKVWVHCALNYRVSAFLFQYHRLVLGMPEANAKAVMLPEWEPDEVWQAFLQIDSNLTRLAPGAIPVGSYGDE